MAYQLKWPHISPKAKGPEAIRTPRMSRELGIDLINVDLVRHCEVFRMAPRADMGPEG
jgi:hypothetical protein